MGCASGPNNDTPYGLDVINISGLVTDQLKLYFDTARKISFNNTTSDVFWKDISNSDQSRKFSLKANGYGSYGEVASAAPAFSDDAAGSFVFDGGNDFGILHGNNSTAPHVTTAAYQYPADYSPFYQASSGGLITVSMWIKTTTSSDLGVWSHCNGGPVNLSYGVGSGKARYWYYTAPWQILDSNTSVNDGQWHNLVWAKSGTNMKIYVDNVLDKDVTLVGNVNGPLYSLGSRWGPCNSAGYGANTNSYGSTFNGSLAVLMAYHKQLSAAEVSRNYVAMKTRFGK